MKQKVFEVIFPDNRLVSQSGAGKGPAIDAMIEQVSDYIRQNIRVIAEFDEAPAPGPDRSENTTVPAEVEVVPVDDDEDYRPPSRVQVYRR